MLKGSCSLRLHPEVWLCVLSAIDLRFFGLNCLMILAQSMRAARILAISMKWFIPTAQKKEMRGAKSSIFNPDFKPVRMYSKPSASV